jgi:hypothetical protein
MNILAILDISVWWSIIGCVATIIGIIVAIVIYNLQEKRKPLQVAEEKPSVIKSESANKLLLYKTNFDYPDSPLQHGWQISESTDNGQPIFKHISDGFVGGSLEIVSKERYAMDYFIHVSVYATLIEFMAKYTLDSTIYACVSVQSRNNSKTKDVWLAFLTGSRPPLPFGDGTNEWIVYLTPIRYEGNWPVFEVNVENAVADTFGKEGWVYKNLNGFRIRGNITIANISIFQ